MRRVNKRTMNFFILFQYLLVRLNTTYISFFEEVFFPTWRRAIKRDILLLKRFDSFYLCWLMMIDALVDRHWQLIASYYTDICNVNYNCAKYLVGGIFLSRMYFFSICIRDFDEKESDQRLLFILPLSLTGDVCFEVDINIIASHCGNRQISRLLLNRSQMKGIIFCYTFGCGLSQSTFCCSSYYHAEVSVRAIFSWYKTTSNSQHPISIENR